MSVARRGAGSSRRSFVDKFDAVNAATSAALIIVLFVVCCIGAAFLHLQYRPDVRPSNIKGCSQACRVLGPLNDSPLGWQKTG
jgi:hypothetical protein